MGFYTYTLSPSLSGGFTMKKYIRAISLVLTFIIAFSVATISGTAENADETVFAASGYGFRQNFGEKDCADADNLIENSACDSESYWLNAVSDSDYATISEAEAFEGKTSLKISGNGLYRKTVTGFKKDTFYYLSLRGMSYGEPVGDFHFGFTDNLGYQLENPLTEAEANYEIYSATRKQYITIQCQDGTWYNRTYKFYTGSNESLDFFVTGTVGTLYLDNIKIFEVSAAVTDAADVPDLTVHSTDVSESACADADNLFPNGSFDYGEEFWKDYNGYGDFVEVVSSSGNKMLHYKGGDNDYFYLPRVRVKSNVKYTCSFWVLSLNGSGAKYGIAALNNPKAFISNIGTVSADYGVWTKVTVSFTAYTPTDIALAVFDNGGEAVFDKIRLFESEKGYSVGDDDKPLDGITFSDSVLGSDGIADITQTNRFALQLTFNEKDYSLTDYSDYDWQALGSNLIPDPTVACFSNGVYGTYYDPDDRINRTVINPDAWWDRAPDYYNGHTIETPMPFCSSAKRRGYTVSDTSKSHTDDGSGAIVVDNPTAALGLAVPKMEANSYYAVTFWLYTETQLWNFLRFNSYISTTLTQFSSGYNTGKGWSRITILVYSGDNPINYPCISIPLEGAYRVDDIAVYKLSSANGAACFNEKNMVVLGDMNYDRTITAEDLVLLKKVLMSSNASALGDANNDDSIDIKDFVRLKKTLAK